LYFVYWYSHYVSYFGIILYYVYISYSHISFVILFRVFNVYLGKYIKYIISVVLCYSDPTFDIDELLCFYGVYRNPPSDRVCAFPVPHLLKFVAVRSAAKSFRTHSSTALPANCLYVKETHVTRHMRSNITRFVNYSNNKSEQPQTK